MKKNNISDEMMARFLENRTSQEETEEILSYLNEEDSRMKDFCAMYQGGKLPPIDFIPENIKNSAAQQIQSVVQKSGVKHKSPRKKWMVWVASTAAMVAILLSIFLIQPNDKIGNFVTDRVPDSSAITILDSTSQREEEKLKETIKQQSLNSDKSLAQNGLNVESTSDFQQESLTPNVAQQKHASSSMTNSCEMIKPNKTPYRILCKNLNKTFVFQWKAQNASSAHFIIKNENNKTLLDKNEPFFDTYSFKYSDFQLETPLSWQLVITFEDGSKMSHSGILDIEYMIDNQ